MCNRAIGVYALSVIGKFHNIMAKRTQEIVEQFTTVLVRVESVINVGVQSRVDVSVVKFPVKNKEDRVLKAR